MSFGLVTRLHLNGIRWRPSTATTSSRDEPGGSGRGFGAERDPARVVFFSDAVFAITVTLLVLEIRPPTDYTNLLHGLARTSDQSLVRRTLVILRDLPEREREEFLRQYHRAVEAAYEPAGYRQLRRLLHVWSLTAIAARQPGYYEELAAVRRGKATTLPVIDAIPDWAERVAAARDRR